MRERRLIAIPVAKRDSEAVRRDIDAQTPKQHFQAHIGGRLSVSPSGENELSGPDLGKPFENIERRTRKRDAVL